MNGALVRPTLPNGWFQVAYSDELPAGGLMPLRYFGKDLVLFRDAEGSAHILDAHCPHLGAHLGYGGKVEGCAVQCPFHAWKFDGAGQCVEVPYAKKIPPKARIEPWPTREANGLIMAYHHADRAAPSWEVPLLPEYGSEDWTSYERRRWSIKAYNQDMAENAVDSAHFLYVHGTAGLPTSTAEAHGHLLHVLSKTRMTTPVGEVEGSVEVHMYGFGFTTTRFRGIVETLLVSSVTPVEERLCDVRFSFMVKRLGDRSTTKGVGRAFIAEIEKQMNQDIPIWENKAFLSRPVLCDGDGPIGLYRRWVTQFYSDAERGPGRGLNRPASEQVALG